MNSHSLRPPRRRVLAGAVLMLACASALAATTTPAPAPAKPAPAAAPVPATPAAKPAVAAPPAAIPATPTPAPVAAKPGAPAIATPAVPAPGADLPPLPPLPPPPPSVLGSEKLAPGTFAWQPQFSTGGPLLVVVNIDEQMAYVYRNGLRIGRSSVSTGKTGHETPTGVFTILQKNREHYSNLYNNAPMPFMQRLTWDGVALHAGKIPGYPASHGCVRLPYAFSELLFGATTMGVTVVINNSGASPTVVAGSLIAPSTLSAQLEAAWAGTWTWDPKKSPEGAVTIVLSIPEQIVHVLRNGVEIGRARVALKGDAPVGTTAYVLLEGTTGETSKIAPGKPALRWQAIGDGTQPDRIEPLAADLIGRLSVPVDFARQVYDILAPGTAVVITGETLSRVDSMSELTVLRADEGTETAAVPAAAE